MNQAKMRHFWTTKNIAPKLVRLGFHDCMKYTDGASRRKLSQRP